MGRPKKEGLTQQFYIAFSRLFKGETDQIKLKKKNGCNTHESSVSLSQSGSPALLTFVIVKKSNRGKRSSSIHFHLLTEFG